MSNKGTIVLLLGFAMVGAGVVGLATGSEAEWIPYGYAVLWAAAGVAAYDYFRKSGK